MGAQTNFVQPFPNEQVRDEDELEYNLTDENVCFSDDLLYEMEDACQKMQAAAACPVHPTLQRAALFAAHLMSPEGLIQMHGLACVHKSCLQKYFDMHHHLAHLATSATADAVYEAVHMVLSLASESALNDADDGAVNAHMQSINALTATPSTFDFGDAPHTCVYLFQLGNVDPDGAPNEYHS